LRSQILRLSASDWITPGTALVLQFADGMCGISKPYFIVTWTNSHNKSWLSIYLSIIYLSIYLSSTYPSIISIYLSIYLPIIYHHLSMSISLVLLPWLIHTTPKTSQLTSSTQASPLSSTFMCPGPN
jgi:hypothetical protein